MEQSLTELYNRYKRERDIHIDEEQFTFFVVFFPSLLVIVSDGIIDMEEWEYLKQLSHFMAKSFKEDHHEEQDIEALTKSYLSEISYMIRQLRGWETDFLYTLRDYLKATPEAKITVLDTMMLFADASDGTSEKEEKQMKDIKSLLDL
ncbi:MAG: hypothetical protein AAF363_03725 [Bacteroidota bacterium]